MITAQLISPWTEGGGPLPARYPKIQDDYTLESCKPVAGTGVPNPDASKVPVVVRCEHAVWEAIVHDPEYAGTTQWYQEDGRQKRYLGAR